MYLPNIPQAALHSVPRPAPDGKGYEAVNGGSHTEYATLKNSEDASKRSKRSCESCRALKVKCEINSLSSPCKRCKKGRRDCVFTETPRKKAKRDRDAVVVALQNKVEALTASLHEFSGADSANVSQSQRRTLSTSDGGRSINGLGSRVADFPPEYEEFFRQPPSSEFLPGDIIERGSVTLVEAQGLLDYYQKAVYPVFPVVPLPAGESAKTMRIHYPCLFLGAMYVASFTNRLSLNGCLKDEVVNMISQRVIVNCEKSLDLIQLILLAAFYQPAVSNFFKARFTTFSNLAYGMALDIGLNRQVTLGKKSNSQRPFSKTTQGNTTSLEGKRAWLVCFLLTTGPFTMVWTKLLDEYCDDLIREGAPSDHFLVDWARIINVCRDAGTTFVYEDASADLSPGMPHCRMALQCFQRYLSDIKISYETRLPFVELLESYKLQASSYIYEIALHPGIKGPSSHPIFHAQSRPLGIASSELEVSIDIIAPAIASCRNGIESLLEVNVKLLSILPAQFLVRALYCVILLARTFLAVKSPRNQFYGLFDASNLGVEEYLDRLLKLLTQLNEATGKCSTYCIFVTIINSFTSWFSRAKGDFDDESESESASCPLQLLSGVAEKVEGPGIATNGVEDDLTQLLNQEEFWSDMMQGITDWGFVP